ncbi:MAG: hypothetical protein FWF66_00920 [Candidatus Bathyarchaeota archaeon]|nr:hypothetical protein [Candidatus Termiticorpusculum sp.]MCL1970021.1 hypothetical protein [Candidatus Termiticorpusculum sp.]
MVVDELSGNTLNVYVYIVRADEPVGTRDVTRGAELSSTSVAFRHLQKLEDLGLIEKDSYGNYLLKQKVNISEYVWVGKYLVPRLMYYSFFFLGAFAAEVSIILLSLVIKSLVVETSFWFLTVMNFAVMLLFIIEGLPLYRKLNSKCVRQDSRDSE